MTQVVESLVEPITTLPIGVVARSSQQPNPEKTEDRLLDLELDRVELQSTVSAASVSPPAPPQDTQRDAQVVEQVTPAADFFETVHVLPRTGFQLGNILSTQTFTIDVYSAFRRQTVDYTAFLNNAGPGISITNQPAFPATLQEQRSLLLTIEFNIDGAPSFNSTIDFTFDSGVGTIELPVSGTRIVLWPFVPELPYNETLAFLTDIISKRDGQEQRIALRKAPRQTFDWVFFVEDGLLRQKAETILFGWQTNIFGIPIWHEATLSTAAVSALDTSVAVQSTSYRDFRVGGQVVLWTDESTFEVAEIKSLTATTIEFEAGIASSFPAGTRVMPVRQARVLGNADSSRLRVAGSDLGLIFETMDNNVDLADTSAFNSFSGKVLLDDENVVGVSMDESFEKEVYVLDPKTGAVALASDWSRGKRNHRKTFVTSTPQELWEVRQLLHALHGQQISFYIPTFSTDMIAVAELTSGTDILPISNIGYARYVQARQPRNVIRVVEKDGTKTIKTVTAASEISAAREDLTVDTNWGSTIAVADISRIEYLEKVRFASDAFTIVHELGGLNTRISAPVRSVFD